jgi:PAS domain S-box-containing protein
VNERRMFGAPPPIDFRRVFESTPVPYLLLRPDLTIVGVNDAYLKATLTRRDAILGRPLFDVFPGNPEAPETHGVAAVRASMQRVLDTGAPETLPVLEYDIPRPAEAGGGFERRYWSPVNSPVLDDDGKVILIISRVEDVTDFVRMKEQLAEGTQETEAMTERIHELETEMFQRSRERLEANLRLQEANQAMAALDRVKTAFFSNVSHELRTPLTLILGPLEELIQSADGLKDDQREELVLAHRNALRLLKLVNSLLDFARIEAGRSAATYEPIDLSSFTCELASVFRSAVERAGLRFLVACPPLSEMVYVDRGMWEQIVLNLLSNAFKFTLQGEIEVALRANGDQAELRIRDTGTGIPAHELPRMFERFHRVEGTRGRTQEGAGIGLALVQKLVELHSGTVRVESREGEGSTFIVNVPFGRAHLPAERVLAEPTRPTAPSGAGAYADEALGWLPPPVSTAPEAGRVPVQPRQHILLAEDNADMRGYIVRLLSQHYEVETVADGYAALAAINAHRPDLVLTDVMMLGMNGIELVRALRKDSRTLTLPVMILSARATEEARIEGIQAGADDYLVKPFSARELLARVAGQLAQSEHARRVQALRAEAEAVKAHLEMVLESVSDAFVAIDRDWRITYLNSKAAEESGQPKAALIGKDPRQDLSLDPASPILTMLEDAMRERKPMRMEYRHPPTGHWWEVRAFPSPEGLVIFSTQTTDRKAAEEALRASRAMFRRLFESAPVALVVVEPGQGRILRANHQAEAMFGYAAEELRGQSVEILLPERDRERYPTLRAGYITKPLPLSTGTELQLCARRKDGSEFPMDFTLGTFETEEGTVALAIIRDVSEHQQAEAEHQARLAAEAANIAKSEFLANMSHELRSPMNTILGFARLMANDPELPAGAHDDLQRILKSGEHLYALVNQVLDLSKLEAGHTTLNQVDFDLHLLLDDLNSLFAPAAANKGLQLLFARPPNVPRYVRSDPLKLRQVLINLLDNAIKFTRTGGISVTVEALPGGLAEGTAEPTERNVVALTFTVADSGPGIAPEELKGLFGAFVQAEAGRRQPHGSGLGLAISRGFVRLLGGEVKLESEVGKGSTVRFEIPMRVVAEMPASESKFRRVLALAHGQPRYRLLVVDDQAEARELIGRDLAPLGFEVREVGNGLEAIAAWQHWRPHLIWMNLAMPMLDGLEATRRIRAGPMGRHVVIIAVSASIDQAERNLALAAGCNDLVRKPFREADLYAALEKHLHVRFIYDEERPQAAPQPLDVQALTMLPEEQRAALEDALVHLDTDAVERIIEAIRTSDAAIAAALAARAREFQYDIILSALYSDSPGERPDIPPQLPDSALPGVP